MGSSIPPADALGVFSTALLTDDNIAVKDKHLLQKFEVIQEKNEEDKIIVTRFLDLNIRDFKTKEANAK